MLFVINNLNVDSSGTANAKPLVKWKDLLFGQWKGPNPLLTGSRGCGYIFSRGCRFTNLIPDRLIAMSQSLRHLVLPLLHHKNKNGTSAIAATRNCHTLQAAGRAGLTCWDPVCHASQQERQDKHQDPGGTDRAAAVQTLTRK